MKQWLIAFFLFVQAMSISSRCCAELAVDDDPASVSVAVEFMDHAAAAFVAREKGWFDAAGLKLICMRPTRGPSLAASSILTSPNGHFERVQPVRT